MVDELPPIQRWLNRILALPIHLQNAIFDEFLDLIEARVSAAREAGTLDVGVETVMAERATVIDDVALRTDPRSGATTHLLTIEIATKHKPVSLARILDLAEWYEDKAFLLNAKSGRVALQLPARSIMKDDGTTIRRVALNRPTRNEYRLASDMAESAWAPTDRETFTAAWQREADDAADRLDTRTIRIATGLLLPIWSALPKDHMAVNRIVDTEGRSWLGRIVFEDHVPELVRKFGVESAYRPSVGELAAALEAGRTVKLHHPWEVTVRRCLVNGSQRFEIVGAPIEQLPWLKSLGCFTEIIAYKTRVFVPTGEIGATLAKIVGDEVRSEERVA